MENVDKTIDVICTWIQKKLDHGSDKGIYNTQDVPQMVNALAELVTASAHAHNLKKERKRYGLAPIPEGDVAIISISDSSRVLNQKGDQL